MRRMEHMQHPLCRICTDIAYITSHGVGIFYKSAAATTEVDNASLMFKALDEVGEAFNGPAGIKP